MSKKLPTEKRMPIHIKSARRRATAGTLDKYEVDDVLRYQKRMPKSFYVIAMLWAAGNTQKGIADQLQIPRGTVKSRTYRALRTIDRLKEDDARLAANLGVSEVRL